MQGGATGMFAAVAMNFLKGNNRSIYYYITGVPTRLNIEYGDQALTLIFPINFFIWVRVYRDLLCNLSSINFDKCCFGVCIFGVFILYCFKN